MTDRDEREQELIGRLAAVWRKQPVPQPGAELAGQDGAMRRTVQWLASAWVNQPVPPARLPVRMARHRPARARRASWRPLAAAAVLVLLLTVPLLLHDRLAPPGDRSTAPIVGSDPHQPADIPSPGSNAVPARGPPDAGGGLAVAPSSPFVELRSGPVRLLLLSQTSIPTIEDAR